MIQCITKKKPATMAENMIVMLLNIVVLCALLVIIFGAFSGISDRWGQRQAVRETMLIMETEGYRVAERRGSRNQYIDGLSDVIELLKGCKEPTVVHTDQGSVYASIAYNELIKDTNIVRSMSRAGKPTDNPVNEALNGWIKEELMMDFRIDECRTRDAFKEALDAYVKYYNTQRPCYAIGYDTPENYRKRFNRGEIERRKTFEDRVLTTEPKFVQKRKEKAALQGVSDSEKEKT